MDLSTYFKPENLPMALDAYDGIIRTRGWPIREKVDLHRTAQQAFDRDRPEAERRESFRTIYAALKGSWQIFRGARSYWSESETFSALDALVPTVGPRSPWSLTMVPDAGDHSELVAAVRELIGVKSVHKQWVAPMAASKFLHFLNPAVFPVYDTQVIENQVLRVFQPAWRDFTATLQVTEMPLHTGLTYYLKYLCFAANLVRPHSAAIMEIFSRWLSRSVGEPGSRVDPDRRRALAPISGRGVRVHCHRGGNV